MARKLHAVPESRCDRQAERFKDWELEETPDSLSDDFDDEFDHGMGFDVDNLGIADIEYPQPGDYLYEVAAMSSDDPPACYGDPGLRFYSTEALDLTELSAIGAFPPCGPLNSVSAKNSGATDSSITDFRDDEDSSTLAGDASLGAAACGMLVDPDPVYTSCFDSGWDGWSHAGNVVRHNGQLTFGSNQGTADGVVSRGFTTVPGRRYAVEFLYAAIGAAGKMQNMQLQACGDDCVLLADFNVAVDDVPRSLAYAFVADSELTMLVFADVSLDLDHVHGVIEAIDVLEERSNGNFLRVPEGVQGALIAEVATTLGGDELTYSVDDPRFEVHNCQLKLKDNMSLSRADGPQVCVQICISNRELGVDVRSVCLTVCDVADAAKSNNAVSPFDWLSLFRQPTYVEPLEPVAAVGGYRDV